MTAQQKTLVTLLAAAGVAGGLGLYAYFGVMKSSTQEAQRPPEPETLLVAKPGPGDPDAGSPWAVVFTSLSLHMPLGNTELERRDGTWRVTAPVSTLANAPLVDALVSEISHAKFKSTLEEHPTDADLVRYGLAPPMASVTARGYLPDLAGGGAQEPSRQRTVNFQVGTHNPFDGSVYVRREGDPRVYAVQGSLRQALMHRPFEWRDNQVFPLEESSLLGIEIKARKNTLSLERATTDKPWRLARPVTMLADPQRVARMVSELHELHALSFPDTRLEPQVRQALEKPQVEATFVTKNGEPVHVRIVELQLGSLPPQAFELCTRGVESVLAQVDTRALGTLDVSAQDFKDKQVLALDLPGVQQVLIHPAGRGETIRLEKAPDTERWEVVEPLPGLAREFKLAALLNGLSKLKAATVGEAQPKLWSRYGIGEDSQSVTLRDGSGQEMARLWVGSEVKGDPHRVWARGSSGDVLELDKTEVEALPLTLTDLLDTQSAGGKR